MLFGLFDGYWYIGLESGLSYIKGLNKDMLDRLSMLLKRVSEVSKPSNNE